MIDVGQRFPDFLVHASVGDEVIELSHHFFQGKTVLLFGIPGAFTPICSSIHLPSYVEAYETLKTKGVDVVACLAVNDIYVLMAWGKDHNAEEKITFLSDWNGDIVKSLGLDIDLSYRGLGVRSKRFSMIVKDGIVIALHIEDATGTCTVSKADAILDEL